MPTVDPPTSVSWAERAADRSPSAQRARMRRVERAEKILRAARRLLERDGTNFTTQELIREADIALQTFYKHFGSKDQVLLGVISELVTETCERLAERGQELPDPLTRLRFYITSVLGIVGQSVDGALPANFVTSEHWRLQEQYPDELAEATRPFAELLIEEIVAARDAGALRLSDADFDAWLVSQLLTTLFHHRYYAPSTLSGDEFNERVWSFCLRALGGRIDDDLR